MNEVETLRAHLAADYPDIKAELSEPAQKDGVWWLDVDFNGKRLVVEWNPSKGFGLTTPDDDSFGENADEFYPALDRVIERIDQLLVNADRTAPPFPVLLARLREKRGVTQQELARRLGIKQASISGLERREDIQLSTVRRVVHALGGSVQIFAKFPEGRFELENPIDTETAQLHQGNERSLVSMSDPSEMFVQLRKSGKIDRAMDMAGHVRQHGLLEMV